MACARRDNIGRKGASLLHYNQVDSDPCVDFFFFFFKYKYAFKLNKIFLSLRRKTISFYLKDFSLNTSHSHLRGISRVKEIEETSSLSNV